MNTTAPTTESIRTSGSANYFALRTMTDDEILNALVHGSHPEMEHQALLEEARERMSK